MSKALVELLLFSRIGVTGGVAPYFAPANAQYKLAISDANGKLTWKDFANSTYESVLNKVSFMNAQGMWETPGGNTNGYSSDSAIAIGKNNTVNETGQLAIGANITGFNSNQLLQSCAKVDSDNRQNEGVYHSLVMKTDVIAASSSGDFYIDIELSTPQNYIYLRESSAGTRPYLGQCLVSLVFLAVDGSSYYTSLVHRFDIYSYNGTTFTKCTTVVEYSKDASNVPITYTVSVVSSRARLAISASNSMGRALRGTARVEILDVIIPN